MFKHSLIYRLLSSSFMLGWLVSAPEEEQTDNISHSYSYRWSSRLMEALTDILYKIGDTLGKLGEGSIAGQDLLGFLGILVFFYFTLDLALNDYSLRRTVMESVLALGGFSMPLLRKVPGLGQGSLILSFFRWWGRTD